MPQSQPCPIAIVEVLVLQRFPYGKDSAFFYYARGELLSVQVGDIVKIPWRNGEEIGVVVKIKRLIADEAPENSWQVALSSLVKTSGYFFSPTPSRIISLKPIIQILEKKYFSPDLLIKLRLAAKTYFVSWNHFAKSVVDTPAKKVRKTNAKKTFLPFLKMFYSDLKNPAVSRKFEPKKNIPWIFATDEQGEYLRSLIEKTVISGRQVLVIVPEKTHLITTAAKYNCLTDSFEIATPILLGKFLPRSMSRAGWKLAREKSPYIFIGTRSAIFAPYSNLGLILLEEGHDTSHKQWDLSPLYDTRKLLNLFYPSVNKIYLSDTPRLQDFLVSPYFLTEKNGQGAIKETSSSALEKQPSKVLSESTMDQPSHIISREVNRGEMTSKVYLINTTIERALEKKSSPISDYVLNKIISVLKKGEDVTVLINHKGIANLIICQDCGQVLRCPKCGKTLSQKENSRFECRFCGFSQSSFERCPRCSGFKIVFKSPGIEKIKEIFESLQKEINFSLVMVPESSLRYPQMLSFTQKMLSKKPLVLLGYSGMIPIARALKNRMGAAVVLDWDEMLFYPDFRSEERAAARFYNTLSIAPKIFIQTADPSQPILQKVINNPYSYLFKDWIGERKKFGYPPFTNILRIDIPSSRTNNSVGTAQKIIKELENEKRISEVIAVPVSGITRKNKYGAALVIKYPIRTDISPIIDRLFAKFGNLRIDPDPEEL